MSADDLKKLNKNKKLIKKLARKYDAFVASDALIKQIPRLLGPGLSKGSCTLYCPALCGGTPIDWNFSYSGQIPITHFPQRRSRNQDDRSQVYNQIPAKEGAMLGCRCGKCRHDGRRADLEYHAGYQLFGQLIEEGVAECWKPDYQGFNESAKEALLMLFPLQARKVALMKWLYRKAATASMLKLFRCFCLMCPRDLCSSAKMDSNLNRASHCKLVSFTVSVSNHICVPYVRIPTSIRKPLIFLQHLLYMSHQFHSPAPLSRVDHATE